MTTHDHNPMLSLYGTPRSVIHSPVSARAKAVPPGAKRDDPEKIGSSTVDLTCLKDDELTSH
jgi:hypothetical protein